MARLELVRFQPHRARIAGGSVSWFPVAGVEPIDGLPQIFWSDGSPWREANLWAHDRATCREVSIRTVQAAAASLHAYARWLEESGTSWWNFPPKKSDRCLVVYRGALVRARDSGEIAASTASQRIRVAVAFYRWLQAEGLFSPQWPMWKERVVGIRVPDSFGFDRTISVRTTSLTIRNRPAPGDRLEGGLFPVSAEDRSAILGYAASNASTELFLMLTLGFFTGMRLGTLLVLRERTLLNAFPLATAPGMYRVAVGPGASPPVATKYGVTGHVLIAKRHLTLMLEYVSSVRRLKRQQHAAPADKDLVFLNRFGRSYKDAVTGKCPAVNVEMHNLRRSGVRDGITGLQGFRFHQTRATFATQLARLALEVADHGAAIAVVKDALLHRDEATTLKYIRFIQTSAIKEQAANVFTQEFLGLATAIREKENGHDTC